MHWNMVQNKYLLENVTDFIAMLRNYICSWHMYTVYKYDLRNITLILSLHGLYSICDAQLYNSNPY